MAKHTLSEAAKLTGKSRSTIHRKLEKGELSYDTNEDGNRVVDTSELIRVYGALKREVEPDTVAGTVSVTSLTRDATHSETGDAAFLRQKISVLEEQVEVLHEEKKQVREEYRQREERLLTMLETEQQKTQTLMLEYKPDTGQSTKPSSLERLAGIAYKTLLVAGLITLIVLFVLNDGRLF